MVLSLKNTARFRRCDCVQNYYWCANFFLVYFSVHKLKNPDLKKAANFFYITHIRLDSSFAVFFLLFFSYFALTHDCTATCDCTIFNSNNVLTSAWKIKAETFSSRLGRNKHENSKKLKHCWRFVIRLTWAATWPRKEFRLSSAFSIESESTREQRTLNFYSFLIELRCGRTLASKWNRSRPHVTPHQS